MATITAGDFRNGVTFEYEGKLMQIVEFQHVKPGKGAAFVRTKMKNVISGSVTETSFSPTDKFEQAYIERREMQYLYNDGDLYYFMDMESYDQIPIPQEKLGPAFRFVKEETMCKIASWKGDIFSIEPPTFITLEVIDAEPAVKGGTATNVQKTAVVETGAEIRVPEFIEKGDKIRIDTREGGSYLERAN